MSYQNIIHINEHDFSNKQVIIIGAGWMADQYCRALQAMGIRSVTVISRKEESAKQCCEKYGYQPRYGGYKDSLPTIKGSDLIIVATPVHELMPATEYAVRLGHKNILVEKPGSLYSSELFDWAKRSDERNARIRIAYNRLVYPNFLMLKELVQSEGGITSCRYTFTELLHTINFNNNHKDVYKRWGIANSLHVISMAHNLIGMPGVLSFYRKGGLPWHPSGSRFVGSGISKKDIPFSFHGDWDSAGRWGVEVMTHECAYRLIPLEKLYRCKKKSFDWEVIELEAPFPGVKEGLAEEVGVMLIRQIEEEIPLVTLAEGAKLVGLAESIFGYDEKI